MTPNGVDATWLDRHAVADPAPDSEIHMRAPHLHKAAISGSRPQLRATENRPSRSATELPAYVVGVLVASER